jgi:uncharacterized protein (DUF488 family)
VRVYTIGFTEKSAEDFFGLLKSNGIELLVDTRLRPDGQLSGFSKRNDLSFFLRELIGSEYIHLPILSPTDDILKEYRADKDWNRYVRRFEQLMDERGVPDAVDRTLFEGRAACLLCSEASPKRCHRRLVAERFAAAWGDVEVTHLI